MRWQVHISMSLTDILGFEQGIFRHEPISFNQFDLVFFVQRKHADQKFQTLQQSHYDDHRTKGKHVEFNSKGEVSHTNRIVIRRDGFGWSSRHCVILFHGSQTLELFPDDALLFGFE